MRTQTTNANKQPSHRNKKQTAKKMYYGGFCLLPWLWLVNYLYFRSALNIDEAPAELKSYVRRSLVGFGVMMTLWAAWLTVFYLNLDADWARSLLLFDSRTHL
jgi:presenilin enhancer 2